MMEYLYKRLLKNPNVINVKCNLCDSYNSEIVLLTKDYVYNKIPGIYAISHCLNCNSFFSNPRLKSEILEYYYSKTTIYRNYILEQDYVKKRKNFFLSKEILNDFYGYPFLDKNLLRKFKLFPSFLRGRKRQKRTLFIPPYIKNGRVLDIGCSSGNYLNVLKKLGWTVKGIDLNIKAVIYAVNVLKLEVENISIEDFHTDLLFDIIYLNMVLEHVSSPKETLIKCYSILKSNGKLVLRIPDFNGLEVRIYKKFAYTLQLPSHLHHFTTQSIKKYLEMAKFNLVRIIHGNSDRDLVAPLIFMLQEQPDNILLQILIKLITKKYIRKIIVKKFVKIISNLGKTSRMTVVAEKRKITNSSR